MKPRGLSTVELLVSLVLIGIMGGMAFIAYKATRHNSEFEALRAFAMQVDHAAALNAAFNNQPVNGDYVRVAIVGEMAGPGGFTGPIAEVGTTWAFEGHTVKVVGPETFEFTGHNTQLCYIPNATGPGASSTTSAYVEGPCNTESVPVPLTLVVTPNTATTASAVWSAQAAASVNLKVTGPNGETRVTCPSSPCQLASLVEGAQYTAAASNSALTTPLWGSPVQWTQLASGPTPSPSPSSGPSVTVPDAPTSLHAAAGLASVTLTWTAPANTGGGPIVDYQISVREQPGGAWSVYPTTSSTDTTAVVNGLTAGTTYDFTVAAVNNGGASSPSGQTSATPYTTSGPPVGLSVVPWDTTVNLAWDAPTDDGGLAVTGYVTRYRETGTAQWTTGAPSSTPVTTGEVGTLSNGTDYEFQVAAVTAAGTGAFTASVSTSPITVPGSPMGLTVTPSDGAVSLTWVAVPSTKVAPVTGYRIYQWSPVSSTWVPIDQSLGLTYTVNNLVNGTSYQFALATYGPAGEGLRSSSVSSTPFGKPGPPAGLTVTTGNTVASLTWASPAAVNGSPVSDYIVEMQPQGQIWDVYTDSVSTSTHIDVNGLTPGLMYSFRVRAVNAAGAGEASSVVTAVPYTTATAPLNLTAVAGTGTAVALTWAVPANNGYSPITDYLVESRSGSGAWRPFNHPVSNVTAVTVTGLTLGSSYEFRVSAVNGAGTGPASTSATAVPGAPVVTVNGNATRRQDAKFNVLTLAGLPSGKTLTAVTAPSGVPAVVGSLNEWKPDGFVDFKAGNTAGTFTITFSYKSGANTVTGNRLVIVVK